MRQSSLVPAAAVHPPPTTKGDVDFYLGGSTATWAQVPDPIGDDDPDLWAPRAQLDGAISAHFSAHYAVRFWLRYGLSPGATHVRPTDMPRPGGGALVAGVGNHVRLGAPDQPGKLDLELDLGYVSVPTVYERVCEGTCMAEQHEQRAATAQIALLVLGRYAVGSRVELMGGFSWQTQPTNQGVAETVLPAKPNVEMGTLYTVPVLGVEVEATRWLHVVPTVQWAVGPGRVAYGLTVGVGVRVVSYGAEEADGGEAGTAGEGTGRERRDSVVQLAVQDLQCPVSQLESLERGDLDRLGGVVEVWQVVGCGRSAEYYCQNGRACTRELPAP